MDGKGNMRQALERAKEHNEKAMAILDGLLARLDEPEQQAGNGGNGGPPTPPPDAPPNGE